MLAVSPDGGLIAYTGTDGDGNRRLWLQRIDEVGSGVVDGSAGAQGPFFSPDGRWVGFSAADKLWKAPVDAGRPFPICDVETVSGASWGPDDRIVVSATLFAGLSVVSARGGELTALTVPADGELMHKFPHHTPDRTKLIYTSVKKGSSNQRNSGAILLDLETGTTTTLVARGATDAAGLHCLGRTRPGHSPAPSRRPIDSRCLPPVLEDAS